MEGLLEPVGLDDVDGAVYLQVVTCPRATATELAARLHLTPARLRKPLGRLVDAGLITRLTGSPTRYIPAPPEVAIDALATRREEALRTLRIQARGLAQQMEGAPRGRGSDMIEIVDGEQAIVDHVVAIQLAAREEVLIVDCPPYLYDGATGNPQETQTMRRGVCYRAVYHAPRLEEPDRVRDLRVNIASGEQARVLPSVQMKMLIADRQTAVIPISFQAVQLHSVILVHPSPLLDALVIAFESLWDRAIPLDGNQPEDTGPTDADREMLTMLAAGMKDRTVARALGITERSVTRRVSHLLRTLGAETRFQAALQASKRGWL
ncbi:helix-turn-helix domain-containing protein [Streptomyces sp. NPDC051183]|uniref:helix-turn-helix domain-containing protein n=1 Tax=Streptomyces sp. NPDC051183 TaxID=3155165 RepID=UPI003439032A